MPRSPDGTAPPTLARWTLRLLGRGRTLEFLLGDLDEEYAERVASGAAPGTTRAWYRRMVWRSLAALWSPAALARRCGVGGLGADLRRAARQLSARPGFSAAAILTMTIGIGANTVIFSVADSVLWQPLPYPEPDRLVRLLAARPGADSHRETFSESEFLVLERRAASLDALAAMWTDRSVALLVDGEPMQVGAVEVTANVIAVLGARVRHGRFFTPADDRPDSAPTFVLSHRLFQRGLGGDPAVVGRDFIINGVQRTLLGVLPAELDFPDPVTDVWLPLALERDQINAGSGAYLRLVGRLAPEIGTTAVQADLERVSRQIDAERLTRYPGFRARAQPLREFLVGDMRRPLYVMTAVAELLLLVVCINVAGLRLAQGIARRRELDVLAALGATRGRILRQLLIESTLLASIAAGLGFILARVGIGTVRTVAARLLPRASEIGIDGRALLFVVAVTVAASLIAGLGPALRGSGRRLTPALSSRSLTASASPRTQGALVATQIALSTTLLAGAALMTRSAIELASADPGFRQASVLTFRVTLPLARYPEHEQRVAFWDALHEAFRALPGVERVGGVTRLPMGSGNARGYAWVDGAPRDPQAHLPPELDIRWVTQGYFAALEIALRRGRPFDRTDAADAPAVAILSESLADTLWPGQDPLGRRYQMGRLVTPSSRWYRVVGVVADVRHDSLRSTPRPTAYYPITQLPNQNRLDFALATRGEPTALIAAVRAAISEIDPQQPIHRVQSMHDRSTATVATERLGMALLNGFAGVALLVTVLGLYSLVSQVTAQRIPELGLRMALGATRARLLSSVAARAGRLLLVGLIGGVSGTLLFGRAIEQFLYGVAPTDPLSLIGVAATLAIAATTAILIPTLRALSTPLTVALRLRE